jgi:hypothetical protein
MREELNHRDTEDTEKTKKREKERKQDGGSERV